MSLALIGDDAGSAPVAGFKAGDVEWM